MTSGWPVPRFDRAPALLAAAALHMAAFLILLSLARPAPLAPMGAVVPITIVATGPTTDTRAAEAAPTERTARTEAPTPLAKAPSPPLAKPSPAKPAPAPAPKPAPKPVPTPVPTPRPVRPPQAKAELNLDALASSVAKTARSASARPALARRGPSAPETAPHARADVGQGVSQSDIAGLSQLLERLWNPNCSVEGGDAVALPVRFTVGEDGRVVGRVSGGGRESSTDPIIYAAARRAIDAVHQAEPYAAGYRGKTITVNFNAKTACSQP